MSTPLSPLKTYASSSTRSRKDIIAEMAARRLTADEFGLLLLKHFQAREKQAQKKLRYLGRPLDSRSVAIGHASCNQAEYHGLIGALELAKRRGATSIRILTDSKLVERQINKAWRVKHPGLKPLYEQAKKLVKEFQRVDVA